MFSRFLSAVLPAAVCVMAARPCGALAGEDPGAFLDTDYDSIYRRASEAYMSGEYEESAGLYLDFLRGNTSNAEAMYNLACCYGLLGDEALATAFMVRSVRAGFEDLGWISWDPDFDAVRDGDLFPATLDSIVRAMEEREAMLGEAGYMAAGTILEYRIRFPGDYDPDKAVPLVIGLHGYGASPEGFVGLWDRFEDPGFIFAVPRAPYNRFSGPDPGYSWTMRGDDEELSRESVRMSEDWVCSLRNALVEEYRISDVYLMGFSQGCSFTYGIGLRHPDLFDGLICFAGWLDTAWVSADQVLAASQMPVVIAHGSEDQVVEYEASTTARDYLEDFGYDVLFLEFEGGHTVDADALVEAQSWLIDCR